MLCIDAKKHLFEISLEHIRTRMYGKVCRVRMNFRVVVVLTHTSVWIVDQETEQCVIFLTLIHLVVFELLCLDNWP